jgi:hypothetical protein
VHISNIVRTIKTPLTLAGFCMLIFYLVVKQMLPLLSPQSSEASFYLLNKMLNYVFALSITSILLGISSYVLAKVLPQPRRSHLQIADPRVESKDYQESIKEGRTVIAPRSRNRD